ncbi:MAG: thioredoxin domain-containing protein [Myxococcales bacterium]|nr:thioredoxin domain-containing protein [Myxococcales bacterium]
MRASRLLSLAVLCLLSLIGIADVGAVPTRAGASPIPVAASDPSWGSATAPVTIVAFTDYECPFCARAHATLEEVKADYGASKLRVVYKHFPLPFHPKARPAAEAAAAIHRLKGNDGFWKFTDEAFQSIRQSSVDELVRAAGLAPATVSRLAGSAAITKKVDDDIALGRSLGVSGTPAFFVNGKSLSGARPKTDFAQAIDDELAAAAALRSQGVPAASVSATLTKKNFVAPTPAPTPSPSAAAPTPKPSDDKTVWKVPVGTSASKGPADAPVTLVVFSDFQCPFCGKVKPTLDQLARSYGQNLRIVFKHNPLPFHKRALPAALLTLEAKARGGDAAFWRAHDKIFLNQSALEDFDLERYAGELGLDARATMAAVQSQKSLAVIEADQELAEEVGARGTPTSFINGRKLTGAQALTEFETMIDQEIAHAKALRARGVAKARVYDEIIKNGKTTGAFEQKTIPGPSALSPIKGDKRAPVTVTVFTDFQCPYCGRAQTVLEQIEDAYPGKVRLVFRHRPLDFHTDAMLAHEAAAEAYRQKGNAGFWRFHDRLFADQKHMKRADLEAHARAIGLDMDQFGRALDGGVHKKQIEADIAIAEKAGINGTPGFVVNDLFISGAQPFTKFKRAIEQVSNGHK